MKATDPNKLAALFSQQVLQGIQTYIASPANYPARIVRAFKQALGDDGQRAKDAFLVALALGKEKSTKAEVPPRLADFFVDILYTDASTFVSALRNHRAGTAGHLREWAYHAAVSGSDEELGQMEMQARGIELAIRHYLASLTLDELGRLLGSGLLTLFDRAVHAKPMAGNVEGGAATTEPAQSTRSSERYDVAISFSAEDRPIARQIAICLRNRGIRVFFDEHAEPEIWGRDLYEYLNKIYEESRLCVVIVSESYISREWTTSELRNLVAHSRLRDSFTILPINVDEARTGLLRDVASIDWSTTNAEGFAALVEGRLRSLPEPSKTRSPEPYHVIRRESGWSVKRGGAARATSVHKTREEAIAAARRIVSKHLPAELVVHRKDGTIASREVIESEERHAGSDG